MESSAIAAWNRRSCAPKDAEVVALREALKTAQEIVCAHTCPSAWAAEKVRPHTKHCVAAQAALSAKPSPVSEAREAEHD